MLSNNFFYYGTIRQVVIAFGSLFSDIHLIRTDPNNNTQSIKVPLHYGPKEKWVYRTKQDPMPGVDDQVMFTAPVMSWQFTSFQYDNSRKIQSTGQNVQALISDNTVLQAQFNPVPYNITFELYVRTKNQSDNLMILEQILPFFTPDYTVSVLDTDLKMQKDIPFVLNGVQWEDNWEGNFNDLRFITATLVFTSKMYLYPPTKLEKVILESQMNFDMAGANGVPDSLPSFITTPLPDDATAETITGAKTIISEKTVLVLALPGTGTLSSGHSTIFSIFVLNTNTVTFTISGVPSIDRAIVSGNKVTYLAGTRTQSETVTIVFTSVADPSKNASVVLTLNP